MSWNLHSPSHFAASRMMVGFHWSITSLSALNQANSKHFQANDKSFVPVKETQETQETPPQVGDSAKGGLLDFPILQASKHAPPRSSRVAAGVINALGRGLCCVR